MRIARGQSARAPRGRVRLRGGRPGNTLVEAAFVLPGLIFVTMAMIECGQYFLAKNTLQAAARDGARTAIVSGATQTQVQQAVTNTVSAAGYASGTYTVTFADPGTVTRGNPIQVTVTAQFGTVVGRPLLVFPAAKQIVGSTTMIKE
jgi:Flp pilus assembly protein TadG